MTNTTARIKKNGINFEILVDMDNALKFRKGEINFINAEGDKIFSDVKKGTASSKDDLEIAFNTTDTDEIAKVIVKHGDVLVNQEHRDEEKEKRIRQVVDFLSKNAIDPKTGHPHSPNRIRDALEQAHVNIKNVPIENQISEILEHIAKLIPIKIETKKIKVRIPAIQTGKAYGIVSQYKGSEKWLENGDLETIVEIPAGMILDFYDKLNSITHGSALTEEIKQ
ncbi:MAG: ribosome assembly factor SBDS [Candidatus Pacearchaeota archaeon]|jgi:ribosome maturation protein SDO1